ncbi:MAG TPA: CRISPR-associated endoribonuclease Cas6 [Hanamia sp.]|nr:CRISPR-associated endoribonuclease Cas6 [Hanamia sp.]
MRLQLKLSTDKYNSVLPANYQYPLSSAIYKIIQQADEQYSAFLHNDGYRLSSGKSFKLFSFSDLKVPYSIRGDRFLLNGIPATLTIGFHIDEAASNFIKGLFINQQIEIADRISGAKFSVSEVQLLPGFISSLTNEESEIILQPLSPLVVGRKNARGNYDFLSPVDEDFKECLIYSWLEKYKAVHPEADTEVIKKKISIEVLTPPSEIRSRLITIKAFTPQQTKIRGFTKFRMKVKASKPLLELALNAGMGLYNAMGCGCVGIILKH